MTSKLCFEPETLKSIPISKGALLLVMLEWRFPIKGAVMQIEKALINDRLRVSKVCWKLCISTNYKFAIIYP